jgi:hypothetical protein
MFLLEKIKHNIWSWPETMLCDSIACFANRERPSFPCLIAFNVCILLKCLVNYRKIIQSADFPRVMSLKDAHKKMSKSDLSSSSRINLNDEPEEIYAKILNAKTDRIARVSILV